MVANAPAEIRARLDRLMARQPIPRTGTPLEIAYAVLFFANDESSYCTGRRSSSTAVTSPGPGARASTTDGPHEPAVTCGAISVRTRVSIARPFSRTAGSRIRWRAPASTYSCKLGGDLVGRAGDGDPVDHGVEVLPVGAAEEGGGAFAGHGAVVVHADRQVREPAEAVAANGRRPAPPRGPSPPIRRSGGPRTGTASSRHASRAARRMATGWRPATMIGGPPGCTGAGWMRTPFMREKRSVPADLVAGPEAAQQADRLVHPLAPAGERHLRRLELGRVLAADADSERDAPAGSVVQIGDDLGDDRRRIQREQQDRGADQRRVVDLLAQPGEPGERLRPRIRATRCARRPTANGPQQPAIAGRPSGSAGATQPKLSRPAASTARACRSSPRAPVPDT